MSAFCKAFVQQLRLVAGAHKAASPLAAQLDATTKPQAAALKEQQQSRSGILVKTLAQAAMQLASLVWHSAVASSMQADAFLVVDGENMVRPQADRSNTQFTSADAAAAGIADKRQALERIMGTQAASPAFMFIFKGARGRERQFQGSGAASVKKVHVCSDGPELDDCRVAGMEYDDIVVIALARTLSQVMPRKPVLVITHDRYMWHALAIQKGAISAPTARMKLARPVSVEPVGILKFIGWRATIDFEAKQWARSKRK